MSGTDVGAKRIRFVCSVTSIIHGNLISRFIGKS
jgi:hypothetical protein